jgi:hypothetical protein
MPARHTCRCTSAPMRYEPYACGATHHPMYGCTRALCAIEYCDADREKMGVLSDIDPGSCTLCCLWSRRGWCCTAHGQKLRTQAQHMISNTPPPGHLCRAVSTTAQWCPWPQVRWCDSATQAQGPCHVSRTPRQFSSTRPAPRASQSNSTTCRPPSIGAAPTRDPRLHQGG